MEKFCAKKKKNLISMKLNLYKKSFDLFLKRTNEKKIIGDFIKANIPLRKRTKFLDIGGGDGTLAQTISKKFGSGVMVEPNKFFLHNFKHDNNLKIINSKWEDVYLDETYDFILAAYVITYFPEEKREQLIKKIYDYIAPGGTALILSVDDKKGSWRKIHSYFYKLMGYKHYSSDKEMKKLAKKYNAKKKEFKTQVIARNNDEMLKILNFDFGRYPKEYEKFFEKLQQFLYKYTDNKGQVILDIVHNAYIINKP
jgi:ubiquinone/menaquinone biosynthesis C-methylase UbiE